MEYKKPFLTLVTGLIIEILVKSFLALAFGIAPNLRGTTIPEVALGIVVLAAGLIQLAGMLWGTLIFLMEKLMEKFPPEN